MKYAFIEYLLFVFVFLAFFYPGWMDACLNVTLFVLQMLKMVSREAVQATAPTATLNLSGGYEIQVATHLTLVQLHAFSRDVMRCLRSLDQSSEEDMER